MKQNQIDIANILKEILRDFSQNNSSGLFAFANGYSIHIDTKIPPGFKFPNSKTEEYINKFNPYLAQKDKQNYSNRHISLYIPVQVKEVFFDTIISRTPTHLLTDLFSIIGNIFSLVTLSNLCLSDPVLFQRLFETKKHGSVLLPSNSDFNEFIGALRKSTFNDDEQIKLLHSYCKNHTILFKRIEIQNSIRLFLNDYFKHNKNYASILKQFEPYSNSQDENSNCFVPSFKSIVYEISRKKIFSNYYHDKLHSKTQIDDFIVILQNFLNQPDNLKKLQLKSVLFSPYNTKTDSYTLFFHLDEAENPFNYKDMLIPLLENGVKNMGVAYSMQIVDILTPTLNKYLLEQELTPSSKNIKTSRNVNKI